MLLYATRSVAVRSGRYFSMFYVCMTMKNRFLCALNYQAHYVECVRGAFMG